MIYVIAVTAVVLPVAFLIACCSAPENDEIARKGRRRLK